MTVLVRGRFLQLPHGEIVAVLEQSIGIDVTAARATPLSEGVGFDMRLEDADAVLGLQLVERLLRGNLPLVERWMPGPLRQQPAERLVILAAKPGEAGGLDLARVVHEGFR